jgi:hypothetical protein
MMTNEFWEKSVYEFEFEFEFEFLTLDLLNYVQLKLDHCLRTEG